MAVNNTIWGSKNSWAALYETDTANLNDDLKVYARPEPINEYAATSIGAPIDKSVCVSGLGVESVLSSIKYLDVNAAHEQSTPSIVPATFADTRTVTNWCFCTNTNPLQYAGLGQANNGLVDADSNVVNTNPLIQRYAPDPVQTNGNTANIRPFTQFSHKNLVMLIMVLVTRDFATYHFYTLDDYINLHTDENLITGVYLRPYVATNDNDIDIVNTRVVLQGTYSNQTLMQIAILDEWGLPVTKPYIYGGLYGNLQNAFRIMGTVGYGVASGYPPVQCRISDDDNKKVYLAFYGTGAWAYHMDYKESNNIKGQYYRFYDETFFDECLTQAACFGLLFTPKESVARAGAIDDDDMYCGILDNDLVGHGLYTQGGDNTDNVQLNWTNSNDSTYDGNNPPLIDNNIYGVDTSFNAVSLADGALKRYVLDDSDMDLLSRYLWDIIDTSDPDELIQSQTLTNFLTNNPLDCIVSIKRFPFADMSQGSKENIRLGKIIVNNTAGRPFSSTTTIRTCGTKTIPYYFNDWRDYLCEYTLVLPFCGTVSLPPEIVTGKTIEVIYTIDYTTGSCTAWVLCLLDDGSTVCIDSSSGNCAIDIPISGIQTADITSQIYNANENLKAMKFNNITQGVKNAVSVVTSPTKTQLAQNAFAAGEHLVNSIHEQKQAEWNIQNTQVPIKMIGSSSGCNGLQHELTPRLIIYKPVTDISFVADDYAKSVGYQCCETGLIGDYKGYAEITNAKLDGFTATVAEKNMIQQILAGGVYL